MRTKNDVCAEYLMWPIFVFRFKLPKFEFQETTFVHQFVERSLLYKMPNLLCFLHIVANHQNLLHVKYRKSQKV